MIPASGHPSPSPMPENQHAPFLAADIGGTNVRLGLVRARGDGTVEILDHQAYLFAEFDSLAAIVSDFLSKRGPVDDAAIASTGIPEGDAVVGQNLPWPVSLAELRALGIARVRALNDFAAVAHATQCLGANEGLLLTPGAPAAAPGPVLVVGPGTGLGAALRVPVGDDWLVLPGEGGQMSMAPGNARERAVLAQLQGDAGYVSVEQAVSGPGLLGVYRTLCLLDGVEPRCATPAEVAASSGGADAHAAEAVGIFFGQLGSLLADMVMMTGATSAFVAGGIVGKLVETARRSDFVARFHDKGVMRGPLERVPVRLVDHPHCGVIGAASWYLRVSAG